MTPGSPQWGHTHTQMFHATAKTSRNDSAAMMDTPQQPHWKTPLKRSAMSLHRQVHIFIQWQHQDHPEGDTTTPLDGTCTTGHSPAAAWLFRVASMTVTYCCRSRSSPLSAAACHPTSPSACFWRVSSTSAIICASVAAAAWVGGWAGRWVGGWGGWVVGPTWVVDSSNFGAAHAVWCAVPKRCRRSPAHVQHCAFITA